MKRIFALFIAAAISIGASAATLLPIQLLNPAGSSSGQAIISTGATTAPAWGGVPVSGLAAIAANTVIANATGSSAIPTAVTVTGCNGAAQALQWTNGSGFGCNSAIATSGANTNITSLSSPALGAATATTQAAGTSTTQLATTAFVTAQPTINQPNLVASTTGTPAASGSQGFYQTANSAAASASAGVPLNVASASLSAGIWDVQCTAQFVPAGSTVQQLAEIGVSTTSATLGAYPTITESSGVTTAGFGQIFSSPRVPLNLTTATTVFCVAQSNFTTSTMQIAGTIGAWLRH